MSHPAMTQRIEPAQLVEPAFCQTQHAPMIQTLSRIEHKLDEWGKAIFVGNGQPAIITRLDRIEIELRARDNEAKTRENEVKKKAERRDSWTLAIFGGLAINFATVIFTAWWAIHHVGAKP